MHWAVNFGHWPALAWLLGRGAGDGWPTSGQLAATRGFLPVLETLLLLRGSTVINGC